MALFVAKTRGRKRTARRRKNRKEPKPRIINDFEIGALLGMGGYAIVNVGRHRITGQMVALKCLLADKGGRISDSKKKQFLRGIDLLRQVHGNRHVIKLVCFDERTYYVESTGKRTRCLMMALEHAPNGELFDYLMYTGSFDEITCRSYYHQLIDGLDAIHGAGYTHRDLKPENLLLDKSYTLKIADFGFASASAKMATACGTKGYLAPELLRGGKYTKDVDIFATGIILFIMFCGFPPFNDALLSDWWFNRLERGWKERTSGKLLDKKREWSRHGLFWAAHERSHAFPEAMKDFLLKVLHYDPVQRISINEMHLNNRLYYLSPRKLYGSKEVAAQRRERYEDGPSWYNGPVRTPRQLGEYLEARRQVCFRERAKKVAKQQHQHDIEAGLTPRGMYRSTADGPSIPSETVSVLEKMIVEKYTPLAEQIDPDDDYFNYVQELDAESMFVSTPFYFLTPFEPSIVGAVFTDVCKMKRASIIHVPKESRLVISSQMEKQKSKMILMTTFEVNIYGRAEMYIISIKRLQGDPLAFKEIINEFLTTKEVNDLIHVAKDVQEEVEEQIKIEEAEAARNSTGIKIALKGAPVDDGSGRRRKVKRRPKAKGKSRGSRRGGK